MFNKNKPLDNSTSSGLGIPTPPEPAKPTPAPATPIAAAPVRTPEPPRPAARSSSLSTLSAGVKYEGNISGAGELQVDGSLKGDIRVVRVVIGEGGAVEGTVHADILEVRGRVSGAIVAKQVKLFATSRVEGDITQEQLSVEQGAWFQGRCTQAKRDTPGANMLEAPVSADNPAKTDAKVEAQIQAKPAA